MLNKTAELVQWGLPYYTTKHNSSYFNSTLHFVYPVSGDWSQIFFICFFLPVYACWTSAIACYACCLICLVVVYDLPVYACWTCYCLHQVVRRSTWVEGSNHPCCGRFPGSSPITKLIYTKVQSAKDSLVSFQGFQDWVFFPIQLTLHAAGVTVWMKNHFVASVRDDVIQWGEH